MKLNVLVRIWLSGDVEETWTKVNQLYKVIRLNFIL